jgi:hypothetical protein
MVRRWCGHSFPFEEKPCSTEPTYGALNTDGSTEPCQRRGGDFVRLLPAAYGRGLRHPDPPGLAKLPVAWEFCPATTANTRTAPNVRFSSTQALVARGKLHP